MVRLPLDQQLLGQTRTGAGVGKMARHRPPEDTPVHSAPSAKQESTLAPQSLPGCLFISRNG